MYLYGTFDVEEDTIMSAKHAIIELPDGQVGEYFGEGVKDLSKFVVVQREWGKHPWIAINNTLKKVLGCQTRREARQANNWMKSIVIYGDEK